MEKIILYDRKTKQEIEEKICFKSILLFLYKDNFLSKILLFPIARCSILSKFFFFLNSLKISKHKIPSFIKHFDINEEEFYKKTKNFRSFNDFFVRKLKEETREIDANENSLVFPCDGRFLVFPKISDLNSFNIKDKNFSLKEFLMNDELAEKYNDGSMLIARLAPQDYHRFHFPCDCIPEESKLINGCLYSVNPFALRKNIKILQENKRMISVLKTKNFSDILYIEIGATNVGSINQTFFPNTHYKKGEEKGYFSLGGSSIVLLFKKNTIQFDADLIEKSLKKIETRAFFGSAFAKKISI
jgi:phosphatidylserine decarboxylase